MPIQKRQEFFVPIFGSGAASRGSNPLAAQEAVIAALNPVGWWKFDEGTGTVAEDSTDNDNHLAALTGSWITGGFDFGTTTYDSGLTAQTFGVSGSNPKTLIVVAKVASATGNDFGVEFTGLVANGERWSLRTANTIDDLRLEIGGDAETEAALAITDNTWFFASAKTAGATLSTGSLSLNGTHVALSSAVLNINTLTTATLRVNSVNSVAGEMDVGYMLLFDAAVSNANIDAINDALITIMAARGVTLP